MKPIILAALLTAAALPAHAQSVPLWDGIVAQARCVVTSIKDEGVVLPQFLGLGGLRAGQYRNPITCAIEGRPSGPQF